MFFPFGGAGMPELPDLMARRREWRVPRVQAQPRIFEPESKRCVDRAGVGRDHHELDKDSRCIYCGHRPRKA